jgi:hypothetical protein
VNHIKSPFLPLNRQTPLLFFPRKELGRFHRFVRPGHWTREALTTSWKLASNKNMGKLWRNHGFMMVFQFFDGKTMVL